jgi:hypothetical protein
MTCTSLADNDAGHCLLNDKLSDSADMLKKHGTNSNRRSGSSIIIQDQTVHLTDVFRENILRTMPNMFVVN